MKKELPHYRIGISYGGNQEFFDGAAMKMGGCAAETACEICIYLDKYFGTKLYPFDCENVTIKDYREFGRIMKPYLRPRMTGIDKLSIYIDGFSAYLKDKSSSLTFGKIEGDEDISAAKQAVIKQIDSGIPVSFLCLYHTDRKFRDYEWHWFIINGYELRGDALFVKAVTYSEWEWLSFDELWNTGRTRKGGAVFPQIEN